MAETTTFTVAESRLQDLAGRLGVRGDLAESIRQLAAGRPAAFDGVWGSARALLTATLAAACPSTLVVVCPRTADIDLLIDDLKLFGVADAELFPAWENESAEREVHDEIYGDRLRVLKSLRSGGLPVIVTSIQSLLQPVPDQAALSAQTRLLRGGETLDADEFSRWLVERGFQHTSAVQLPGEFSVRGGIIDVFAPDWFDPVRIELFGDQIDSMRRFEVQTQRSLMRLESVDITLLEPGTDDRQHVAAYLPADAWCLLIEPAELQDEGQSYRRRLEQPEAFHTVAEGFASLSGLAHATAEAVAANAVPGICRLQAESVERFSGEIAKVRDELDAAAGEDEVHIVCETEAETTRLGEVLADSQLAADGRLHFSIGHLQQGFRLIPEHLVLISGRELFQRAEVIRPSRRRLGRAIDSFLELREGDLIVHLAHGVGRYLGLELLEKEGQTEEHLALQFYGGTKVYVPASKVDLVQKYVGGRGAKPTLARLGGKTWVRQKQAAMEAVTDLASDMIEMEARRSSRPGIALPPDSVWQQEFDASFPYQETPDQVAAIAAIKSNMQAPRPMDRLLCGDVGFGKTEIAIRAAFKAVDAGYQVAVLVPTTVLCEQHLRTFRGRMAEFPFEIAGLSRFCSKRQQREILQGLAAGTIDIAIGTHRLAQRDVEFHNLGLLIIDEEQRFGVEVKQRLKSLRATVDVLTMTATPIPRTLHMSLLGVRDISNLETAPAERQAVETRVSRFDPELIRHAILRELNRGGQIYFVHNRVQDIHLLRHKLQQIVPEASVDVGHGQMAGDELERVMLRFVDGQFDVLLATTIVESGLDIPNANTIFIDEADRYGLADLHQLRGRVGRYKHRAYCYLLIEPGKSLSPEAARRLRAIEEFSDIGAGFAISMRDLEIRGAGNILGTQQSGHIAAVGYELYCNLLESAVRWQKKLPPKETIDVNLDLPCQAYLPSEYVPDMRLKIDLYRRLARLTRHEQLAEFETELVDRFGPLPVVAARLLTLAQLRIWAHYWLIHSVHLEDRYVVFRYSLRPRIEQLRNEIEHVLRIVDHSSAYLPLDDPPVEPDALLALLKSVLQPR